MLLNPASYDTHGSMHSPPHRPRGRPQYARTFSQKQSPPSPPPPSTGRAENHGLPRRSRCGSQASYVPPSMKSVISQVGVPPLYVQRKKRLLDDPLQSMSSNVPMGIPQIFRLQDLDLETEFQLCDMLPCVPLYERPKRAHKRPYCRELCELEVWPNSAITADSPSIVLPDRRPRQPGLNPHFLKLYAIETSSRLGQALPNVNIDETLLRQLTYEDLRHLDVSTPHVSGQAIRLALATRKKLWTEMVSPQRQDLYGEGLPQNQRFLLTHVPAQGRHGSLLRLDSEVKPWLRQENSTMLRPCGALKVGAGKPDVQYVVKGWCDVRFVAQR